MVFLIYLALALTTVAVFWQVHNYDFVKYDDTHYVTLNQQVKAGLTKDGFIWAFTTGYASNWHPLTWLSHMLDCYLFGQNAGWHHLTNLLLHIANTLLLFAVLKQMTEAPWRSAFVAAAFAVHPLHVESVAWIAERKDVLSTFFWMLTMVGYVGYVKRRRIGWYLLALLFFALGLMSKPMLVTLPFVLLLLDYWPLGRFEFGEDIKHTRWGNLYKLTREKVPFFVLSAISSVITFLVQQGGGAVVLFDRFPILLRTANALISYLRYIEKMFWPSGLAVLYPVSRLMPIWLSVASVVLILAAFKWIISLSRSHKYLPVGWLWYVGTLVPVIGLIQVGNQAWADRYSYIPLTGLFIIIAWGVPELLAKWRYRKVCCGILAVVVLAALSICTHRQLRHWQNSTSLFKHTIAVTENNTPIQYNLGLLLQSQGKLEAAANRYRQALKSSPNYVRAHNNLGNILQSQSKLEEAANHYRQVLTISPNHAKALNNLGNVLQSQGRFDEAINHYRQSIDSQPDYADAHNNLAAELARQGKIDEALNHYRLAIKIQPDFAAAYYNLANALYKQGELDAAIETAQLAIKLANDIGQKELADAIGKRLQFYKDGKNKP